LRLYCKILVVVTVFSLAACDGGAKDGSGYAFKCDISANPRTLDPQTAVDANALTVVSNLFEGLLRLDENGRITAGMAKEYSVSDDGLIYEFVLREDVYWTDRNGFEAPCVSDDFVFAFRRLFNPATKSRNAETYFCVKNSEKVNDGLLDPEWVGVRAEGDFNLRITLEYPAPDFLLLLTGAPAFPCNEEFYIQSAGRYGLGADFVPSNGAFYLSEWVYDEWWTDENRVILKRNAKNDGGSERTVFPSGINFYMDRGDFYSLFESGASDCVVLSGEGAVSLINRNYPNESVENAVWGVAFNTKRDRGQDFRSALALATDRDEIGADIPCYSKTSSLIPGSVKIGDNFYRDLAGGTKSPAPDAESAKARYERAAARFGEADYVPVMIVPNDKAIVGIVGYVTQQWQEKLSFFCRIETLDSYGYNAKLSEGDYDLAVVRITASYNSPSAIFEGIYAPDEVATLYQKARFISDEKESAALYKSAEEQIIKAAHFIPLCFQTEYFFRNKKSEDLIYNPFTGTVVFREGKMFK
jgi:oligopeptide transport system substrate-binding protein